MRTLKATLAALVIVTITACGSDGGAGDRGTGTSTEVSSEAERYIEALSTSFTDEDSSDLILDEDQADCVAARWVGVITPERLEENGFEPEALADPDSGADLSTLGLSEADATTMTDGFGECGVDLRELILTDVIRDGSTPDALEACFEEAITDDVAEQFFVAALTGTAQADDGGAPDNVLAEALSSCTGDLGG